MQMESYAIPYIYIYGLREANAHVYHLVYDIVLTFTIPTVTVCEMTFETWADTLSGHNKICMDTSGLSGH